MLSRDIARAVRDTITSSVCQTPLLQISGVLDSSNTIKNTLNQAWIVKLLLLFNGHYLQENVFVDIYIIPENIDAAVNFSPN